MYTYIGFITLQDKPVQRNENKDVSPACEM